MRAGISRRRFLKGGAAAALAAGVPMLNFGSFQAFAGTSRKYSARAVKVVERSLVIDMLGVLKIDFTPEAYASPLSDEAAEQFRSSGINAFHNSIGTGGPSAVEDTLTFLAAWQGYAGRNSHVFTLVGRASDLDQAKTDKRVAVIMGLQNSEHFRTAADVEHAWSTVRRDRS